MILFLDLDGALRDARARTPDYSEETRQRIAAMAESDWLIQILDTIKTFIEDQVELILSHWLPFVQRILAFMVLLLDKLEGPEGAGFDTLVAALLQDLLDVPVSAGEITKSRARGGRNAAMGRIGDAFLQVLVSEFAPEGGLSPQQGREAAARFMGFVMGFSTKQGVSNLVSKLVPWGLAEWYDDTAREFATNLSLGRMMRLALRPWFEVLVATPLEWSLNEQYRPTDLSPGEALQSWTRGNLSETDLHQILARRGYRQKWIDTLKRNETRMLGISDVTRLLRWGNISEGDAVGRVVGMGYSREEALLALQEERQSREEDEIRSWLAVLQKQVLDGFLPTIAFRDEVEAAPLYPEEKRRLLKTLGQQLDTPRRSLSLAQWQGAVVDGHADLFEFEAFVRGEGYPDREQRILISDLLIRMAEEGARREAREERERLALERQQQERIRQLELQQLGAAPPPLRALTLAQMSAALRDGLVSAAEWEAYLAQQGYDSRSRQILTALATPLA